MISIAKADQAGIKPGQTGPRRPLHCAAVLTVLGALASGGCLHNFHPMEASGITLERYEPDPAFSYPAKADFTPLLETGLSDGHYQVQDFQFPSTGGNGQPGDQVEVRYYQSRSEGCHHALIVLPIWGSFTYPSEKTIESLRKYSRGELSIVQVLGERRLIDWEAMGRATSRAELWEIVDEMAQRIRRTVIDVRRLLDWIESRPELACGRQALIGYSISAIVGANVLHNEPRLEAGILVMGGGQPGLIAANCPGRADLARQSFMPRLDLTAEQFGDEFGRRFEVVNPSRFVGRRDPSTVLMIDARNDLCMPPESRDSLWRSLGKPDRYTIQFGHKNSFLAMTPLAFNFIPRRIRDFLRRERLIAK